MRFSLDAPNLPLSSLSERSQSCITRLAAASFDKPDLDFPPPSKFAAVLVLLYEVSGQIRVLLTTRSKNLRTHSGQTALPGGKVDASDKSFLETALRESNEEVALPMTHPDIHPISLIEPFLSAHGLVVVPVVALLTDPSVISTLNANEAEVSRIFDHPLEALLDPTLLLNEDLVQMGSEDWPYPESLHNISDHVVESLGGIAYRMHRFRSVASPVKGLTADILTKVAEIAYEREPTYKGERYAAGQRFGHQYVSDIQKVLHTIEVSH